VIQCLNLALESSWPEIQGIVERAQSRLLIQWLGHLKAEKRKKIDLVPREKHDRLPTDFEDQDRASPISMAEAVGPPQSLTQREGCDPLRATVREVRAKL